MTPVDSASTERGAPQPIACHIPSPCPFGIAYPKPINRPKVTTEHATTIAAASSKLSGRREDGLSFACRREKHSKKPPAASDVENNARSAPAVTIDVFKL